MKLKLAIELSLTRKRDTTPEVEQFEHRDNDGTLVIHQDQPTYVGFKREEEPTERIKS